MPGRTPQRLSKPQILEALAWLPGVHRGAYDELRLRVQAPTFADALRLVAEVGTTAEEMDHHPDIDIRWRNVSFTLSTHSVGGVTELDVKLAGRILEHAEALGAEVIEPPDRVEIALDAADPAAIREFWRVGLGYADAEGNELCICVP